MAYGTPGIQTHEQWLGLVQPVGLVVARSRHEPDPDPCSCRVAGSASQPRGTAAPMPARRWTPQYRVSTTAIMWCGSSGC